MKKEANMESSPESTKSKKSIKGKFLKILIGGAAIAGGLMGLKWARESKQKYNLANKVVLITGGSRGLGLILARQLAEQNATVIICAKNQENLSRAATDLASRTDDYLAIPCDITKRGEVKEMIQEIVTKIGKVDVLINNAGKVQIGPHETMTEEDYQSAMKVHFWGPYYLINEIVPFMIQQKEGRIVNIVSIGGKLSFPHLLPYNASKFALSGLSEGLTAELSRHNIKVTTVYPGLMRTGGPRNADVKGQHKKEFAWFKISDSLPLISMNADKAAEQIINAMKKGKKTITLTLPARIATLLHGISPSSTITIFDWINFLLPNKDGGTDTLKGYESSSKLSSSFLTRKTDEAEIKNLERG